MGDPLAVAGAVLIAVAPSLAALAYFARKDRRGWLCLGIGGVGWFAALLLRLVPLQLPAFVLGPAIASTVLYFAYAAVLAGIFEEGVRYLLLWKAGFIRADMRYVLCFGLGWGLLEAVLIYAVNVVVAYYLGYALSLTDLLPGAVERNLAVVMHVALTLMVFKAFQSRRYLFVAMALHAAVDFAAVASYYTLHLPVWHVEGILLVIVLILAAYAAFITKKKKAGSWQA